MCFFSWKQGVLSTQRGQSTMLSFDSYERSLIEVTVLFSLFYFISCGIKFYT